MKLTNSEIYQYAQNLRAFYIETKMPVRINFYLQKNNQLIQQAAEEIDKARMEIGAQFGVANEEGTGYNIPLENMADANRELNDLFNLEQDIPIHKFKLDDFDGIELTYQQMSAIMFTIEE